MRTLLVFLFVGTINLNGFSQLADGSISPDFTLTDLNGVSHSLYADYLDQNKHVIIDFSATWCPPCWSYHNTHAIRDFYDANGPNGSDIAMAFFIEGDTGTNTNCLYGPSGCSGGTQGDWVTGTTYPIIDAPTSFVVNDFAVPYWPTIYIINGYDNRIFETGAINASWFEDWMDSFELEATAPTITAQDCQFNGSIALGSTGGWGNIQYNWSNGVFGPVNDNLEAGDYYVTLTDGNGYFIERGPYTVPFNLTNGNFNVLTVNQENVSCFGSTDGMVVVDVPNEPNINYQWSNGSSSNTADGLAPGIHSLLVFDDQGCSDMETFTISEPAPLNASHSIEHPNCDSSDGMITISVNGGTPPYEYQINGTFYTDNQIQNLPADVYDVTIYDFNNCTSYFTTELVGDDIPVALSSVNGMLDCANTEVELYATGSSSNSFYNWFDSNGVSVGSGNQILVNSADDYQLIVTNSNGCTAESFVTVDEDYTPPSLATEDATLTCASNSVTLCMTATDASNVFWDVNGQQINELCIEVEAPGTYYAFAEGANGCQSSSSALVSTDLDIPVAQINAVEVLTCTNTTEIITAEITGDVSDFSISWTSTDGNILNQISPLQIEVDAPGVYELNVIDNDSGCELTTNVLVEEFINTPMSLFSAVNNNDYLELIDLSMGSPSSWEWTIDGAVVSTSSSFDFPLTGELVYEVCLTISNECSTDLTCSQVSIVPALSSSSVIEHVDCFGNNNGAVLVFVEGGVPPYEVEVNGPNGFNGDQLELSNLAPGDYNFIIRDSEFREMQLSISIEEPTAIQTSFFSENPLCYDFVTGSIELNVEGGTGTYTYLWSNGSAESTIDNLAAGTYSVVVTDELGCTDTEEVLLTQPNEIVESGVLQQVTCSGESNGSITLSVVGGTGTLALDWSQGLEGLTNANLGPGTYELLITDENGCSLESAYFITEPDPIQESSVLEHVSCFGESSGSITLSVTGGTGEYDLLWNDDLEGEINEALLAGTYTVQISDENECSLTAMYTITQPNQLEIQLEDITDDFNGEGGSISVNVLGGVEPYEYNWSNGMDTEDVSALPAGTYTLEVIDANGCSLISETFEIEFISDLNDISTLDRFKVFPNPAKDWLNVKLDFNIEEKGRLSIIDQLGKEVLVQNFGGDQHYLYQFDTSNLTAGVYLLNIETARGIAVKKMNVLR